MGTPFVRRLGDATDPLPFYWITWPNTNKSPTEFSCTAFIEIDARKGQVTHVELPGKGFRDEAFVQQVSNRLCSGVSPPRGPSPWAAERTRPLRGPKPTRNEVFEAIGSWLWLCQKLGIDPGGETNLASVNWSRSGKYDDPEIWKAAPVCRVTFNNATEFQCLYGIASSHTAADAHFTGYWPYRYPEEKAAFRSTINKRWEDLAKDLEQVLVEKVRIPKTLLAPLHPSVRAQDAR